jgi:hypothetical protein
MGASQLLFGTDSSYFPRGWNYGVFGAQTNAMLVLGIEALEIARDVGAETDRSPA